MRISSHRKPTNTHTTDNSRLIDIYYCHWCKIIFQCCFVLPIPNHEWWWTLFYRPVDLLFVFFGEVPVHLLYLFVDVVIRVFCCFVEGLWTLDISSWSDALCANIFSHSVEHIYIFFYQSLSFFCCVGIFLIWHDPNYLFFDFCCLYGGGYFCGQWRHFCGQFPLGFCKYFQYILGFLA